MKGISATTLLFLGGVNEANSLDFPGEAGVRQVEGVSELGEGEVVVAFDHCLHAIKWASTLFEENRADKAVVHYGRVFSLPTVDSRPILRGPGWNTAAGIFRRTPQGAIVVSRGAYEELGPAGRSSLAGNFIDVGTCQLHSATPGIELLAYRRIEEDRLPVLRYTRTNLTGERGELIGRQSELEELSTLCKPGEMVTLWGIGGVGKTALAWAYGVRRLERDPAGEVWFIDLSDVYTRGGLLLILSNTLEINLQTATSHDDVIELLGNEINGRSRPLLILDNAEHATEPLREIVGELTRYAPDATWLITSREAVELDGEKIFELSGLEAASSIMLFEERIKAARPDFMLGEEELDAMVDLAEMLDGLPLAIEVVAARGSLMTPQQLRRRLVTEADDWPSSLAEERANTVDHVVSWSWHQLGPAERDALVACSSFSGPFTLDAAQAVIPTTQGQTIVEILEELSRLSLVQVLPPRPGEDWLSYGIYDSVGHFIRRHIDEDRLQKARRRHVEAYAQRARRWRDMMRGPEDIRCQREIARDIQNVVVAFQNALKWDDESAAWLGLAVTTHFLDWEPLFRTKEIMSQALQAAERAGAVEAEAELLLKQVAMTFASADIRAAQDMVEKCWRLVTEFDLADELVADAAQRLGAFLSTRNEFDRARQILDIGLERAKNSASSRAEALVLCSYALMHMVAENREDARRYAEMSVERARESGNSSALFYCLLRLSQIAWGAKETDLVLRLTEETLELSRRLNLPRLQGQCYLMRFAAAAQDGDFEQAQQHLHDLQRLAASINSDYLRSMGQGNLAQLHLLRGNFDEAYANAVIARDGFAQFGAVRNLAYSEIYVAVALAGQGKRDAARELFDSIEDRDIHTYLEGEIIEAIAIWRLMLRDMSGEEERLFVEARVEEFAEKWPIRTYSEPVVRFFRRHLQRCEKAEEPGAGDENVMRVGAKIDWFQPPGEEKVDISRRQAIRRIFEGLVRRRLEDSQESLDVDDLIALGWPGQTLHPESGANRVYVAIATLRDLGLRDLLVNDGEGYLLSPQVDLNLEN